MFFTIKSEKHELEKINLTVNINLKKDLIDHIKLVS